MWICGECGRLTELQEDLDDAAVNALPWLLDELAALRKQVEAMRPVCEIIMLGELKIAVKNRNTMKEWLVAAEKLAALRAAQPTKETEER